MNQLELVEKLKTLDEILLMEILEISSEDLVEAFLDKVEEKEFQLRKAIQDNE